MLRIVRGAVVCVAATVVWGVVRAGDSDTIEAMIAKACAPGGARTVTLAENPASADGTWTLDRAILLPDDFTLVVKGCTVELGPGVRDNIIRNVGAVPCAIVTNRNIVVRGEGRAVLSGGTGIHFDPPGDRMGWRTIGVLFCAVEGFAIENLTIRESHAWGISVEHGACRGRIADIRFEDTNRYPNQDGIDVRKGAHDIVIENITGVTGDDAVALTGLRRPTRLPPETPLPNTKEEAERLFANKRKLSMQIGGDGVRADDDIHHVTIRNVHAKSCGGHGVIRLLCQGGVKLHHVDISDVVDEAGAGDPRAQATIRIVDSYNWSAQRDREGDMHHIRVRDVTARGKVGVWIKGTLCDSSLSDVRVPEGTKPFDVTAPLERVDVGVALTNAFTAEDAPLEERFWNPPASARLMPIYLGDIVNKGEKFEDALREILDEGAGGTAMSMSWVNYLQKESDWTVFRKAVLRAHELGMRLWLYDERGFPSGTAGGETLKDHPEWAARGLHGAATNVVGGCTVELSLPTGTVVSAAAYPVVDGRLSQSGRVDLRDRVDGCRLRWDAPVGSDWRVIACVDAFVFKHTPSEVGGYKIPYINVLMAEPTDRFLELTHERYAARFPEGLGTYFDSTFTDEPGQQAMWITTAPWPVLPWSPNIERVFRAKTGRELGPLLPSLFGDTGDPAADGRARVEFWDLVADLISENFFGRIQNWCRTHGVRSGGHLLSEEKLLNHVGFYGDFFRCQRRLDAPGIDSLHAKPLPTSWMAALTVGSISDMTGNELNMCEIGSYVEGRRKIPVSEDDIVAACYVQLWGGVNSLPSFVNFERFKMGRDVRRRVNERVGRVSTMLRGGVRASDIALYHPVESVWAHYVPTREGWTGTLDHEASRIRDIYDGVARELFRTDRGFSLADAQGLSESRVEGGELRLKGLRWRTVVMPGTDTVPAAVMKRLIQLWKAGGDVIFVGARPVNTLDEFPSQDAAEFSKRLLGEGERVCVTKSEAGGRMVYLPFDSTLDAAGLMAYMPGPVIDSGADSPIRSVCRRIGGRTVYFAFNYSYEPYRGTFRFKSPGVETVWNPETGTSRPLENPTVFEIELKPLQGIAFTDGSEMIVNK